MSEIQWDGKLSNTNEIHSNPPPSHTYMNLYLPHLTREIFLTSRTTRFLAPLGFYVSMTTSEGSSCYYHQSLTSRPSAFTLSVLMDSTFLLFDWQGRMCFSLCLCLFQGLYGLKGTLKHRRVIMRSIFNRNSVQKCQRFFVFYWIVQKWLKSMFILT